MSRRKPTSPRKVGFVFTNIKQEPHDGMEVRTEVTPVNQGSCDTYTSIKQEACDPMLQGSQVTLIKQEACDPSLQGSQVTLIKQEAYDPTPQGSQVTLIKQEACDPILQSSKVTSIKQETCDPIPQGSQVTSIKQEACDPILQGSQVKQEACDPSPQSSQVTPIGKESESLQGVPTASQETTVAGLNLPQTSSSDDSPEYVWHAEKNTVIMTSKNNSTSTTLPTAQECTVKEVSLGSLQVMEILPLEENPSSSEGKTSGDGNETISNDDAQDRMQTSFAEMSKNFCRCDICKAWFVTQHNLQCHMKIHIREAKKLNAESADQLAETRKEAMSDFAKRYPFQCNLCGEHFKSVHSLGTHRGIKHNLNFTTAETKKVPTVSSNSQIEITRSKDAGDTVTSSNNDCVEKSLAQMFGQEDAGDYRCHFCSMKFNNKKGLARHLMTAHKSRHCATCKVQIMSEEEARRHQVMHLYKQQEPTGEQKSTKQNARNKPLVVGPGQSVGLTRSKVDSSAAAPESKRHRYLHACDVCKATFLTQHHLNCHVRIHMREMKKLKAESADQLADNRKEALSGFAKRYPFRCDVCGERFQSKHGSEMHMVVRHYQQYTTANTVKVPTVGIVPDGSLVRGPYSKRHRIISKEGGRAFVSSKACNAMSSEQH
ncbi:uncharacterized protein LOC144866836 [Branchiostoma floridae x Branchiostoma japonicum]